MQSFVKMSKLTDIVGRADYISNEKRQEHIIAENSYADWKPYQEYERSHQKTNKANNEGRELIIALPNDWQNLDKIELSYRMNMLAQKILPDKYEYQWAIHLNKKETNLHAHLIFSERSRSFSPVSKWDRDIYLTNDGKVARRKADRAVDVYGNVKPPIHRKGEPKSDGKVQFTVKDTRYKSSKWLEQVKQDVIKFYKDYGVSIDTQGFLHQYHEGKGSESNVIHAKNKEIKRINGVLMTLEQIGFVFPERSSKQFRSLLQLILPKNNIGESALDIESIRKFTVYSPETKQIVCHDLNISKVLYKLMKENGIYCLTNKENNDIKFLFAKSHDEQFRQLSAKAIDMTKPEPKTDIESIVKLKHDYVRQCCILHYLDSCHKSTDEQETYTNAQNVIQELKKCSLALISANDEYKNTFNPFKRSKLHKELDKAINEFESAVHSLERTLSLSVSYNIKTFNADDMDRILSETTAPLDEMKKKADIEVKHNRRIDELRSANVTDMSVRNALKAFQTACSSVDDNDKQEVYDTLKNAPTPYFSFEQQGKISRGRLISSGNVSNILSKLDSSSLKGQEREHIQQQHKHTRRGR